MNETGSDNETTDVPLVGVLDILATPTSFKYPSVTSPDIITNPSIQVLFSFLYVTIFVLGVSGNILVCYVVLNNRAMLTVTNLYITNLAMSDILLCILCVPFTPLYSFIGEWVFGHVLCHLVPYSQGVSIYLSTLTLMSIAVDRYFVIIHPFRKRMKLLTAMGITCGVWGFSIVFTLPYGIFMRLDEDMGKSLCEEKWPSELSRHLYGVSNMVLQFILPFIVITFCYIRVSIKMSDRIRLRPGAAKTLRLEMDRERKRCTNRMLIAMVTIFGFCWLPLNLINLLQDVSIHLSKWRNINFVFFVAHVIAMSSTCYNPILYAWLNKNFREEFRRVLPCFDSRRGGEYGAGSGQCGHRRRCSTFDIEKSCNGNETVDESLCLQSTNSVRFQHENHFHRLDSATKQQALVLYNVPLESVQILPVVDDKDEPMVNESET